MLECKMSLVRGLGDVPASGVRREPFLFVFVGTDGDLRNRTRESEEGELGSSRNQGIGWIEEFMRDFAQ